MKFLPICAVVAAILFQSQASFADFYRTDRPDSHAPVRVMGDHLHKQGEWMTSYRYSYMFMGENRVGTDNVSDASVLRDFMITPTHMSMQMHTAGLMYAPSDDLTLSLMLPVMRKDMEHITRTGLTFRTNSEGIGDLKYAALLPVRRTDTAVWHLNIGGSAPTGSINEIDDIPLGKGKRLPYPMQLGSGTWDSQFGLTMNEQLEYFSWGAQALANIHWGHNRIGYSLGDEFQAQTWIAVPVGDELSFSGRLDYRIWSNIDGNDPAQISTLVPTADPDSRGGKRIDLSIGVNLLCKSGPLQGHRFAFEIGTPVFENLDGPQLSTDWFTTVGWQKAF